MFAFDLFSGAPPVLLAPMAGVMDAPARAQAQAFGCAYTVSEMIAGDQLAHARPDMLRKAAGAGKLSPLVIQLAGREARWMARGAALAADAGADVIDINMGCPAKQVTSGASGSALMRDPDHALRLIEAVVAGAGGRPVTLKMRLGWCRDTLTAPEIARRAAQAGVSMIAVHGRTRSQFYRDAADWTMVRDTVEAAEVPVIVNGDIHTAEDARRALAASGAAGVMIGRAAVGRPWLPGALARALRRGGEALAPPPSLRLASLLAQLEDTLSLYGQALGLRIIRKHVAASFDDLQGGSPEARSRRASLCRIEQADALRAALVEAFAALPERIAA